MSLFLFGEPTECSRSRPSGLSDQHLAWSLALEDLLPLIPDELRTMMRCPAGYLGSRRSAASQKAAGSTVKFDKDAYQANLDVKLFKPEEISVKVSDNVVTVEGKHEEKKDEHGSISRHFVRKYVVPEGHDADKVESRLSSDGVLTITAPKVGNEKDEHRSIPVIQTGQPSKAVEQKGEKMEEKVEEKNEEK